MIMKAARRLAAAISGWSTGAALVIGSAAVVSAAGAPGVQSTAVPPAAPDAGSGQYRTVIQQYCITCHNDRLRTAGVSLQGLDPAAVQGHGDIWEKVLTRLRAETMPPPGRPRPEPSTYKAFAASLEASLDRAAAEHPNPIGATVHRLNRAEYGNAVRDLLAIDIDLVDGRSLLPPDDTGYGFDNIADVLSVSPMLMERYLSAGRKIARLAVGDPSMKPGSQTYPVSKYARQDDRMSDDLPFGSRAGAAIAHYFPVDGEFTVKVNLLRTYTDLIRGLREANQLEIRIDGKLVQRFTVGGRLNPDGTDKSREQLNDEQRMGDAKLEVRVPVQAGPRSIGVSFVKQTVEPEGLLKPQFSLASYEYAGDLEVPPSVASVVVSGPYNAPAPGDTPSRREIFTCRPINSEPDTTCAAQILGRLGRRAFRRPLTADDLQSLLGFYALGRKAGGPGNPGSSGSPGSFDAGIQFAIQKILVSPDFLFRIARDPAGVEPGAVFTIPDVELASRLSFFLWSSIPDDELLQIAERGQLRAPGVLEQQLRRMLADRRSQALIENFAGQWLQARNLRLATPDPIQFSDFDENLREAFQRETDLFFESQLREDRSVVDLLDADYTFVNERLARHYGIPHVYGNHFRRVQVTDENRRGLLGQGTVLTITSYANRTAPTIRGKWVLENILGAPPPPPPSDVPSLMDETVGVKPRTMRERMEQHRTNPVCASCHVRMDPIGFALESFDAVGRYRTTFEGTTPIDVSGTLPDGTTFNGPGELRRLLLAHQDEFVATLTRRLLTYALGRGAEYQDMPAVRKILRAAKADDYRWSALMLAIVRSEPFQMRKAPDRRADAATAAVRESAVALVHSSGGRER